LNTTRGATLYKWWQKASQRQRWELVTTAKAVGKEPPVKDIENLLDRLGDGQYPFRGTDQSMAKEEDLDALEAKFERGLRLQFDSDSE
jgi:hypothetical protein